ncbi:uncharacterized protein [Setaria viridis]|uniref:Uncharacterized protein n=1 Tax=Setaria viridis TaxID=4556 RepID=A0A4U6VV52_SETVI|nr:hypothetical protein SEVIR_2G222566v2 [Setaria viridis]
MSPEDVSDNDVEAFLGKFFKNYRRVPVLLGVLRHFDGWYESAESRVLAGFTPSEDKEVAEDKTEDAPSSPPAKKRRVVRKKPATQHAATASDLNPEESQGTKATSVEVVTIARDVAAGVEAVEELLVEEAPSNLGSAAPEQVAPEPIAPELGASELGALGQATNPIGDEATASVSKVLEPSADGVANALKTPEVTANASLPEDVTGGEYTIYTGSHAYVISTLVLSGLGENVENFSPMASVEPAPSDQPVVVEKRRVRPPLRSARDAEDIIPVEV